MKLILVDDFSADRKLFAALLTGGKTPWLRDITLTTASVVPPFSVLFMEYDGMILDERLGIQSGYEIAREIHALNWNFPVVVLTTEPMLMPLDALSYCDAVLSKRTDWAGFSALNPLFGLRSWVRNIARVIEARKANERTPP